MGYATVVSGGEDGRYVIEIDSGEAFRVQYLAAATAALAQIEAKIIAQQDVLDDADAAEAAMAAQLSELFNQIVASMEETPGVAPPAQKTFETLLLQYRQLQAQHTPARIAMRALKAARVAAQKRITLWTDLPTIERKPAWCADLTTDATGYVATLEIKGESDLVLIAPGAPTPNTALDGSLMNRELLSPATAYYNAALLPGWQKYKPTFRWGTISAIDHEAETCTVALADALSSAQRLDVNQSATLADVPITYMQCGHTVFEVGDRVVVKFQGLQWENPRVIGFLDNPRACLWPMFGLGPESANYSPPVFGARNLSEIADILAGSCTVEARVSREGWVTLTREEVGSYSPPLYRYFGYLRDFREVSLYARQTVYGSGAGFSIPPQYIGCVWIRPAPMSAALGTFPDFEPRPQPLEIVEVRVTVGGDLAFNAAVVEGQYAHESSGPMRVRGLGGHTNTGWANAVNRAWNVIPGTEYQLFAETED